VISGLDLYAYWTVNLIFDIAKTYVPVLIALGMVYGFNVDVSPVFLTF